VSSLRLRHLKSSRYARRYGAAELIDYTTEDLRGRLKALTDGKGVDVIYDPVGGAMTIPAIKKSGLGRAASHYRILAAGDIPAIPSNQLLLKSAASLGVLWGMSLRADPVHHARNIQDLLDWLAAGRIRPAIDAVSSFGRCEPGHWPT
jgi:NADPH2:quinone reductase